MKMIRIKVLEEKQVPETLHDCNEVVMCFNCAYDCGVGKTDQCRHRVVLSMLKSKKDD